MSQRTPLVFAACCLLAVSSFSRAEEATEKPPSARNSVPFSVAGPPPLPLGAPFVPLGLVGPPAPPPPPPVTAGATPAFAPNVFSSLAYPGNAPYPYPYPYPLYYPTPSVYPPYAAQAGLPTAGTAGYQYPGYQGTYTQPAMPALFPGAYGFYGGGYGYPTNPYAGSYMFPPTNNYASN